MPLTPTRSDATHTYPTETGPPSRRTADDFLRVGAGEKLNKMEQVRWSE